MRTIAFVTQSTDIRQILASLGVDSEPSEIALARGSPLWDKRDALADEGTQIGPDWATNWDEAAQPASDFEVDQRIHWWGSEAAISAAAS